ncbi:hypothetical protein BD626DRAFT_581057 [Schizophyllum amplum]|uniref:Uncharacterized protein n=1 Tax=Schizophyllum amplum TaxID=97359 RepID=A0A550CTN2_9AGAR|nr:hypothetical protein BD626DRAFT_581057 [Auriculariopsis ampla]
MDVLLNTSLSALLYSAVAKESISCTQPPDALQTLNKHTPLIVWGSLLDQHLGIPRIQRSLTLLVPDAELDALSATLTSLGLPLATLPNFLLRSQGDLLRCGRLHDATQHTDLGGIEHLHLVPKSLPAYIQEELEQTSFLRTSMYVPRTSAVYAGIFRMMLKYRLHCVERYRLESDLELLVGYNLLRQEKGETYDDMDKRREHAVERIRSWGRNGEWRKEEEWVEDLLVAIVKGEQSESDAPSLGTA